MLYSLLGFYNELFEEYLAFISFQIVVLMTFNCIFINFRILLDYTDVVRTLKPIFI